MISVTTTTAAQKPIIINTPIPVSVLYVYIYDTLKELTRYH